jgi:hypothetical protein
MVHVRILCSLLFARSEETIAYFRKDQESNTENFKDKNSDETLEVVESLPLIEWFAENYKRFGTDLEIVTNKSQEGSQFCKGFGGIGGMFKNTYTHTHARLQPSCSLIDPLAQGLLRYRVDFGELYDPDNDDE